MQSTARDRPIVIIGAGGIVRDAHLPAYRKAGFRVTGIYDLEPEKARTLAHQYSIPRVFAGLEEAGSAATSDTVFDIAVPAASTADVLRGLPGGHGVLIQKPMGEDIAQARVIRDLKHGGIGGAISVQARQSLEETTWLLDQADQNRFLSGVVGWAPLTQPAVDQVIGRLAEGKKLKGLRHILHDEARR